MINNASTDDTAAVAAAVVRHVLGEGEDRLRVAQRVGLGNVGERRGQQLAEAHREVRRDAGVTLVEAHDVGAGVCDPHAADRHRV